MRIRRFYILLIIACHIMVTETVAQYGNTWYFGHGSGANFNPPGPGGTGMIPAPLPLNTMKSDEGSSVMCDRNGEMIIYCNAEAIYNRKREVMKNGSGLKGHMSSFQSSIIVARPGSETIFYVFVTDGIENNLQNGYTYSIVDMSREGGDGEVIQKNLLLYAPCTERLAAVKHANGADIWIITNDRFSNRFQAWLLTCNGLHPQPVISDAGASFSGFMRINVGVIKVSPDGKKLCHTHFDEGDGQPANSFFQLFDFDNATGVVSNAKAINFFDVRLYGAEFSPDSRLLYITDPNRPFVLQLDASLPTAAAIRASAGFIPAWYGYFALQAGPDGKIYAAHYGFKLSAINNPNVKGPGCNFSVDNIPINGLVNVGLPLFINTAFSDPLSGFQVQILDSCTGRVQFFGSTAYPPPVQWLWDFGDGNTSTLQNPVHTYTFPKKRHKVTLRITSLQSCGVQDIEKFIVPSGIQVEPSFRFEPRCDSGFVRMVNTSIINPPGIGGFTWFFGDGNSSTGATPTYTYAAAGVYDVTLRYNAEPACLADSITRPFNNQPISLSVTSPVVVDEGASISLSTVSNATSYRWSPPDFLSDTISASPVATPYDDRVYRVTARNGGGCSATDSVILKINPIRDIYVPEAFTPNNDGRNDVFKPVFSRRLQLERFAVFNRWGQLIYSSGTHINLGWDGLYKGVQAGAGTYAWQLTVYNREGRKITRKGTVVLIR